MPRLIENERKNELKHPTHTLRTAEERDNALMYILDPNKRLRLFMKPASISKGYEVECADPRRCMSHLAGSLAA